MANVLNNLIPDIYVALDEISREIVGVIPGVTLDSSVARAAVGQTVRSPVAPAATATDVTPGVTPPNDGDQTIGNVNMTISKSRRVPIRWNGEQTRGVNNGGPGQTVVFRDQVKQAIRTLVNEIELDLVTEVRTNASRAYGTPATTPFGTANDLTDSSETLRIIEANGGGTLERSLVLSSAAMSNIRGKQSVLFKVNEAGTDSLLRRGILGDLHGSQVRQTAQLSAVAKGTAAGATTNAAGYAVGDTVITLASAGTGTILAGDFITFAGDTNKYGVVSGDADVSNGGAITLAEPGLRVAIATSATAITVGNAFTPNVMFAKSAVVLATRAPALPRDPAGVERDMAVDRMTVQDPVTGLVFEMSVYDQYRQIQYELAIAWGQRVVKAAHTAMLLG